MDRAASLIFPGTKTLAGWWRRFAPYDPRGIWIGYAYIHRVEAPVEVLKLQPVEPLVHLLLQAIDLAPQNLANRLGMPGPILASLLLNLERDGLIVRHPGEDWSLTERGRGALDHQEIPVRSVERRTFPFLERLDASGQRQGPPDFVPITECVNTVWAVEDPLRFEIDLLHTCVNQPFAWKQAHGFPLDVERVVHDSANFQWEQVIVDKPERVLIVILCRTDEAVGLAVKADGWGLHDGVPALRMPLSGFPDLAEISGDPTPMVWREAWRTWCKQRSLPGNEVESCVVNYVAPRVEVQAPPRLVQRLQAANSDLLKGEAWLVVGDGFWRAAAPMVLRPLG